MYKNAKRPKETPDRNITRRQLLKILYSEEDKVRRENKKFWDSLIEKVARTGCDVIDIKK